MNKRLSVSDFEKLSALKVHLEQNVLPTNKRSLVLSKKNFSYVRALYDIISQIVERNVIDDETISTIRQLYQDRWGFCLNSNMYRFDIAPHANQNIFFILFAHIVVPGYVAGSDNVRLAQYQLLFPTLSVTEDVYGQSIADFSLNEIMICGQNNEGFLAINDCLQYALHDENERRQLFHTCFMGNAEKPRVPLSAKETSLLKSKFKFAKKHVMEKWESLYKEANKPNEILDALIALRSGIQQGDVQHEGEEMVAGAPANIAIAEFAQFIDSLSPERREFLFGLRRANEGRFQTFGELWELFDQPEYSEHGTLRASTCLHLRGRTLEEIIATNMAHLATRAAVKEKNRFQASFSGYQRGMPTEQVCDEMLTKMVTDYSEIENRINTHQRQAESSIRQPLGLPVTPVAVVQPDDRKLTVAEFDAEQNAITSGQQVGGAIIPSAPPMESVSAPQSSTTELGLHGEEMFEIIRSDQAQRLQQLLFQQPEWFELFSHLDLEKVAYQNRSYKCLEFLLQNGFGSGEFICKKLISNLSNNIFKRVAILGKSTATLHLSRHYVTMLEAFYQKANDYIAQNDTKKLNCILEAIPEVAVYVPAGREMSSILLSAQQSGNHEFITKILSIRHPRLSDRYQRDATFVQSLQACIENATNDYRDQLESISGITGLFSRKKRPAQEGMDRLQSLSEQTSQCSLGAQISQLTYSFFTASQDSSDSQLARTMLANTITTVFCRDARKLITEENSEQHVAVAQSWAEHSARAG